MTSKVLIVGAGPVGLTMAAELARYGVPVRIIDKAAARSDKSKALVLWSRTLELLDRAGCTRQFIAAGHKVDAANIIAANKLLAHVSFAEVNSPYPYALMLPQSETERLLEAHLNRLGVQVERGLELIRFAPGSASVCATLRSAAGEDENLDVPWMIGCDGAHSATRHGLGMPFVGDTLPSDWILADIHLKAFPFPASEIATYWHEKGVLAVFPISSGRYRIVADLPMSTGEHPRDPDLSDVQGVLVQRGPGGLVASDPVWLSSFRINERKVADYRSGCVFLAGDAAHVHSPAGGQGMNTGMQDAFNLAWKLAMVWRGACDESLLDSYSVERSAIGEHVLANAGRFTALATLRNQAAQIVRNLVGHFLLGLAPVRAAMVNEMTEVSVGYEKSPLNGPAAHGLDGPAVGARMTPVSGQTSFGAGQTPRFTLLAASSKAVSGLVEDFGDLVEPSVLPPPDTSGVWLVRPDGYVACAVPANDIGLVADYLKALRRKAS
ncbi:FAD-dependent monooxygenase [Afipia clevelandensis]|nr:FAD-dependent monooxygenase [Afipia clevelandensis]